MIEFQVIQNNKTVSTKIAVIVRMSPQHVPLTSPLNLLGLREAAAELGVSVEPLMLRHNIDPSLLESFEGFMPAISIVELVEDAAETFNCPHFGLLAAKHRPGLAWGVLTQLIKASPNVGVALRNCHRRLKVFTQSSLWDLRVSGDTASIVRINRHSFRSPSIQVETLAIGSYFKLLKALMGAEWHPTSITLTRPAPPPASAKCYRQVFEAPVYFDRELNCINLKASDLQIPIPTSDPELLAIVEQHIATLEASTGDDICSQVNLVIRQLLDTGTCTMNVVAEKLGLHSKSLQRALQAENTTFKELLNESRMQVAKFYLSNSEIELVHLTDILGYSDPSAFSRSFKKQHGVSPQHWRQGLSQSG